VRWSYVDRWLPHCIPMMFKRQGPCGLPDKAPSAAAVIMGTVIGPVIYPGPCITYGRYHRHKRTAKTRTIKLFFHNPSAISYLLFFFLSDLDIARTYHLRSCH